MEEKEMRFRPEWVEKYHANTAVLSDCVEQWDYLYREERGTIYLCRPWPGIAVWANKVFMSSLPCETAAADYPFVKLNYCISGRCEVLLETGKYVYLTAGMLSIDCNRPKEMFHYPTKQYEGLEIVLNLDELREHPVVILEELGIGTGRVDELVQHNHGSFIARVSAEWDAAAKSLINLLKTADGRLEDYRFYSLQLLYMLRSGHTFPMKSIYVTKGQRRIAAETANRINHNLQMDCTVEQLAVQAGVSSSSLKKYFSLIYDCPVAEYVRGRRMEQACLFLKETDMSVGEIAEKVGYAHQGKFGSVFKKYTGHTPLEYRRMYRIWNKEKEEGRK